MKTSTHVLAIVALTVGAAAMPARADGGDSGDSLRELSAQWWQWAFSIPTPSNPLVDPTGANCMVGQRGPVWFLAGSLDGGTIRRTCAVPEGVALFFPVMNSFNINTPGVCGSPNTNFTVAQLRAVVAASMDTVTGLSAKVDNKPVRQIRRVRSEPFSGTFPIDNIFVAACAPGGFPAGTYSPGVDDGYYVKVNGLSRGVHTLNFRAVNGSFVIDAEYILNVVPVSREVKD